MNEQKRKYRVTNWRAYNAALVARGSLTFWFDEAAVAGWYETERTGRRGAPGNAPRNTSILFSRKEITVHGQFLSPIEQFYFLVT